MLVFTALLNKAVNTSNSLVVCSVLCVQQPSFARNLISSRRLSFATRAGWCRTRYTAAIAVSGSADARVPDDLAQAASGRVYTGGRVSPDRQRACRLDKQQFAGQCVFITAGHYTRGCSLVLPRLATAQVTTPASAIMMMTLKNFMLPSKPCPAIHRPNTPQW